jgi:hypothetical protein
MGRRLLLAAGSLVATLTLAEAALRVLGPAES